VLHWDTHTSTNTWVYFRNMQRRQKF